MDFSSPLSLTIPLLVAAAFTAALAFAGSRRLRKPREVRILENLTPELRKHVLSFLDFRSLCSLAMTNSMMRNAANDDELWRNLYRKDYGLVRDSVMPPNRWKGLYAATRAVFKVNTQLFNIMRDRSLPEMRNLWLHTDYVKCIHITGQRLSGYDDVIRSWGLKFHLEQFPNFEPRDVRVRVVGSWAWVHMIAYVVDAGNWPFTATDVTNIFEFHDNRWYLVHHQISAHIQHGQAIQQA